MGLSPPRLKRKRNNRGDRMGLLSALTSRVDAFLRRRPLLHADNWDKAAKMMPLFAFSMNNTVHPVWGKLFRKAAWLEGKDRHTQAYIVPIHREVSYRAKSLVSPADKIKKVLEEASFRAIMNRCICRDSWGCRDFPHDLGCFQLGEGARQMVARGIAREATAGEAVAHLERAATLGLVAVCAWVELESVILGIPKEEDNRYLEICLCCPCCCVGMRTFKNTFHDQRLLGRFNTTGWRARGMEGCTGCGKCVNICPMNAVRTGSAGITVREQCIGCGLCAVHCPEKAIVMDEITPMKDRIQDYFQGLNLRLGA